MGKRQFLFVGLWGVLACVPARALDNDLETIIGWVQAFNQESQKYAQVVSLSQLEVPQIKVSLDRLATDQAGVCITPGDGGAKELHINSLHWSGVNEVQKQLIVYHELGHCVLKREHRSEMELRVGYYEAVSIMHPSVLSAISDKAFQQFEADYYTELFSRSPSQPFIAYIQESLIGAELIAAYRFFTESFKSWTGRSSECRLEPPNKVVSSNF